MCNIDPAGAVDFLQLQPTPFEVGNHGSASRYSKRVSEFATTAEDRQRKNEELLGRREEFGPVTPLRTKKAQHISLERRELDEDGLDSTDADSKESTPPRAASALITPTRPGFGFKETRCPSSDGPPFQTADGWGSSGFTPRPQTPRSGMPDSPTLPSVASYTAEEDEMEAGRGQRRKGHGTTTGGRRPSTPSAVPEHVLDSPLAAALMEPTGQSSRVFSSDSSFSLDRCKGENSITILPSLGKASGGEKDGRGRTASPAPCRSYFDHSPERQVKHKASTLHAMTPLSFQRFDTATRLASVMSWRDHAQGASKKPSPPRPDKESKTRTASSTIGSLFRKYSRSKVEAVDADTGASQAETRSVVNEARKATSYLGHFVQSWSLTRCGCKKEYQGQDNRGCRSTHPCM
ncbi:hypothetical protein RJ55_08343 [Drechmeria coniospora]|nr:hypothetical protein RJ55_08343 [Drechmeria coniospora]